jgi:hypothetical protein
MEDVRFRLRLIGYWWSVEQPEWPSPQDWVDPDWDPAERELVAHYLAGGQRAPYVAAGPSFCRICQQANGNLELTDGTYLWPEGLAHYVAEHSVRLPDEIIRLAHQWEEPESWTVDRSWWRDQEFSVPDA